MKNVIEIVIGIVATVVLVFFIHKWIKEKNKKKLEQGGADLGALQGLGDGDDARIVIGIKKDQLSKQKKIVDNTPVIEIADAIHSAKGTFKDDNDLVYATLGRIKSKAALSYVSNYFKQVYKVSLIAYLQDFMNLEELGKVNNILKQLK